MPAERHDLTIEQGATWEESVQWLVPGTETPVDLTNYTARMQIRPNASSDVVYASLTSSPAAGITITAATGIVTMRMSATTTAALSWRDAVYDLELESSTGVVTRLIEGRVTLSREVTR